MKKRIYLNEFNMMMGNATYLPLVSGLLRATAEANNVVRGNYAFEPFIFHMDRPETIMDIYEAPDVAAFSVCMWNEQINLHIAEKVKARWPDCLIVFGGPQVPHKAADYFAEFPFIDAAVRAEGEEAFTEILIRHLESERFDKITGISWRDPDTGDCIHNIEERPFVRDLDEYPSPYLQGYYDYLLAENPEINFQVIMETNRGCPFLCTFCLWGKGGLSRKYRYHSLDRVRAELDWCAENEIQYVFNADSNFGMHKRDWDIAIHIVELKKQYGYPEKFRTCYGKNTDERIFEIGALFHEHQIEKGITLSRQSLNEVTLKAVKRDNIKLEVYSSLQQRFNDREVPVYCEMILGLPGETYDSWKEGIETLLGTGLKNQLFIYHCQVFTNTELADPAYIKEHGMTTQRMVLDATHIVVHRDGWISEFEDTVIATNTLSNDDWRRASIFSWMTMLMHSMKAGFFLMGYLTDRYGVRYTDFLEFMAELKMAPGNGAIIRREVGRFNDKLDDMMAGRGRGSHAPEYGDIYWDMEEFSFLRIAEDLDRFYDEFEILLVDFLTGMGKDFDPDEVREAVRYQRLRIPYFHRTDDCEQIFRFNFPEYFEKRLGTHPVPLRKEPQTLRFQQTDFAGDTVDYAREVILWGRKSGLMLTAAEWYPADQKTSMAAAE